MFCDLSTKKMLNRWSELQSANCSTKLQRSLVWYKNNLKFPTSTIKLFVAPTDCTRFNAIQHTYSELWITRYVDRVRSEIIGRMPFAERSRAIWFKALYSWVHSLHGNQLECDSGLWYLRIHRNTREAILPFNNCERKLRSKFILLREMSR